MDKLEKYRGLIQQILNEYVEFSASDKSTETVPVFDKENDRYLLMEIGRVNGKRIHFCLVNLEIKNEKIWIHYDGTEANFGQQLIENGVPKSDIVPAFMSPEMRKFTDFAVA
ncbi:MAG: XisI protein [Pyrinomonadaceae bacterium]|nr:XisI protein [Pyrinomonadaceae bacterium]